MKNKLIKIIFVFIALFVFCDVSLAATITSFGTSASAAGSSKCNSGSCASTEWLMTTKQDMIYGVRISVINSNGTVVGGTTTKNFWATNEMLNIVKKYYDDKDNKTNVHTIAKGNNISVSIGLQGRAVAPKDNDSPYKNFFNALTEEYINNILTQLGANHETARDKYLKVEPIYVLKEKHWGDEYYDAGTSLEIIRSLNNRASYGQYYVSGGNNSTVGGDWNVIRDMVVSLYFDCSKKTQSGLNVSCYNSSSSGSLSKYKSISKKNNKVPELNELYAAGNGLGVGYIKISDYVSADCISSANVGDTIDRRIELYNEFAKGILNYLNDDNRALLNTFKSGRDACKIPDRYDNSVSCLNGSVDSVDFSKDNLSYYNDRIEGVTSYCLTSFNLTPTNTWQQVDVTSGRIVPNTSGVVATGILTKKCYVPGYSGNSISATLNYSELVRDVLLGDTKLEPVNDPTAVTEFMYDSGLYVSTISVDYRFSPIYVEKITGQPKTDSCSNCQFLTYGLLSKFNEKGIQNLSFSFNFNGKTYPGNKEKTYCSYNATPEIIVNNDKLNLEFRPFSNDNAFPGISGNTRSKGSNWSIFNLDYNKDDVVNIDDLNKLEEDVVNNIYVDLRYDINADFKVDQHDFDLIRRIINEYLNNKKDTYAEEMLAHRPNSYGYVKETKQTGVTPKYVIELTPSDIKDIRNYNKETSYDDYDLVCDQDGNNCISTYLTSLKNKGILQINNSSKR